MKHFIESTLRSAVLPTRSAVEARCLTTVFALCMFGALHGSLRAQSVMVSSEEIQVVGNFVSTAPRGLAVVDRVSGQVRLGTESGATVVWTGPISSTLGDITAAATGTLGTAGPQETLMLVSRTAQRIAQILPATWTAPTTTPAVLMESPYAEPGAAVGLSDNNPSTENTAQFWMDSAPSSGSGFPGLLTAHSLSGATFTQTASGNVASRFRSGTRARLTTSTPWRALFMGNSSTALGEPANSSSLRIFNTLSFGSSLLINQQIVSNLPSAAHFCIGFMDASGNSTLVVATPNSPTVTFLTLTDTNVGQPATFTASSGVISSCVIDQGTVRGVMLILTNGKAELWKRTALGFTLVQTFTPNGEAFSGVFPHITGNRLTLLGKDLRGGPSTSARTFTQNAGGTYDAGANSILPSLKLPNSADVFFFTAEPFADAAANLAGTKRIPDWTTGTRPLPATTVNRELFSSATNGLGSSTSAALGTAPAGATWVLANQYRDDTSVFALTPEVPAVTEPSVSINPTAGLYPQATGSTVAPFPIRFTTTGGGLVFYRTAPGPFKLYAEPVAPNTSPELSPSTAPLLAPTSVRVDFYAQLGNLRSRIQTATYGFLPASSIAPVASVDANQNGLSDEWERYYGQSNPNADPDGDGRNNLTEQNAGTDPNNPTDCGDQAIVITKLATVPAQVRLNLTHPLVGTESLERSSDLIQWIPLTVPAGNFTLDQPVAGARMYYRVRK